MTVHLWGIDYRRSDSKLRTKLYIDSAVRKSVLQHLREISGIAEIFYLATCHRVEFYTTSEVPLKDMTPQWIGMIEALKLPESVFYQGYAREGTSALRHLFRVASSLESKILGEPQILGQIKQAMDWMRASHIPLSANLNCALEQALSVAKQIRHETGIGKKSVSLPRLAVEKYQQFREARHPNTQLPVALVGRSKMIFSIARWFSKVYPTQPLVWANRSIELLKNSSEISQGKPFSNPIEFVSLAEFVKSPRFHALFTATSSPSPLFDAKFLSQNLPAYICDLASPSDTELEGLDEPIFAELHLSTFSELEAQAIHHQSLRKEDRNTAELLIEEGLKKYYRRRHPLISHKALSLMEEHLLSVLHEELSPPSSLMPQIHKQIRRAFYQMRHKVYHDVSSTPLIDDPRRLWH